MAVSFRELKEKQEAGSLRFGLTEPYLTPINSQVCAVVLIVTQADGFDEPLLLMECPSFDEGKAIAKLLSNGGDGGLHLAARILSGTANRQPPY